jgi:hypothetical protein
VEQRLAQRDLARLEATERRGQLTRQLLCAGRLQLPLQQGPVAEGARQELGLVQRPVLLDQPDERLLVAVAVVRVLDAVVVRRAPAQAHDLVHRRHVLGTDLDAREAVGAVVDAVRVLGEVRKPCLLLAVPRIADEAVRLGERGRPDEVRVDLKR